MEKKFLIVLLGIFSFSCSSDDKTTQNTTCPDITEISLTNIMTTNATVTVSTTVENSAFEYGLDGFTLGQGINIITNGSSVLIESLDAATAYNIYARSLCPVNASEYQGPFTFTTAEALTCISPTTFSGSSPVVAGVVLNWSDEGETAWNVEYGLSGFPLGSGNVINTSETSVAINNLLSGTPHDFYVQANCGSEGFGELIGPLPLVPN